MSTPLTPAAHNWMFDAVCHLESACASLCAKITAEESRRIGKMAAVAKAAAHMEGSPRPEDFFPAGGPTTMEQMAAYTLAVLAFQTAKLKEAFPQ